MPQPNTDNVLLGWTPADAASRSLQAVYGFAFLSTVGHRQSFLQKLTEDTITWLKRVSTFKDAENIDIVKRNRTDFEEYHAIYKFPVLSADAERLWRLFMERYDFYAGQLRANVVDVIECFDLEELSKIFSQHTSYFHRLPLSSELVVGPWKSGLRLDLVIPPRLLILDTILMFLHARHEHEMLENDIVSEEGVIEIQSTGRLDSYVRQTLILATSALDNVLTEYGYVAISALKKLGKAPDVVAKAKAFQEKGVSARLQVAPKVWAECFERPTPIPSDVINDMLTLVEIRNRLVHPDGRINCWYAFQLDHTRATNWNFSSRLHDYIQKPVCYRIAGTNIGYEFCLAEFCVDTLILTIDYLNIILFSDEHHCGWLKLPRGPGGVLDVDAVEKTERILQNL